MISAVAANLVTIAGDLDAAWQEGGSWRTDFENATGAFASRLDVLREILESVVSEVEFIVGDKVTNPQNFGQTVAESFRSGLSGENISYGLSDYLERSQELEGIIGPLVAELTSAIEAIGPLSSNFDEVIAGQEEGDIEGLGIALQELVSLFVAAALAIGLTLGG